MKLYIDYEAEENPDLNDFDYSEVACRVGQAVLDAEGFSEEAEVNLALTSDQEICRINREFRNIDAPTDVLSFPAIDFSSPGDFRELEGHKIIYENPDTGNIMLGDIMISIPKVFAQASAYGHSVKREFAFLIAHSMLHLLGYDHIEPEEAQVMEEEAGKRIEKLRDSPIGETYEEKIYTKRSGSGSCLRLYAVRDGLQKKEEEQPKEPSIHTSRDVTDVTQTPEAVPTETEDPLPEGMMESYLSGSLVTKEIGQRRPVAVMLNNIREAVPQTGIAQADVVYEAPVEGNITRLMGIFENYDNLEKIGSVRSCREYYLFFAQEFESIYAHYGQAIYAKPFLEEDFIHNLSGLGQYSKDIFYRTTDRVAPHNAYTSFQGIQKGIEDYGYTQEHSKGYKGHYLFADMDGEENLESGQTANVVRLNCFETNKPWFEYDPESRNYKRFQYDGPQIDDADGEQLTYDNLLIQYHSYKPYDQNGYLNIDAISGGKGKYITHGKAIDIRWEKDAVWGVTHYFDENNQEIRLNRGKTWVAIALDDKTDGIIIE